jgi:hypothetical protein
MNPSPSCFAVHRMLPNASDPAPGSVMAQAPIVFRVTRSGTHRSRCSNVPRLLIASAVRPTLTPSAVTNPGQ